MRAAVARATLSVATCAAVMLTAAPAAAGRADEVRTWQRYFDDAGVTGAFLLYEPSLRRSRTSDVGRSETRYLPASTFKIFNALAAIEAGVIAGPDEPVPWDRQDRCVAAWNQDLSLRGAYRQSAFWVYQVFARRVGAERMHRWLREAQYGNQDIAGGIDRFWLDGALRTSLVDQVAFLVRLHEGRLPFSAETIGAVREIMIEERGSGYVLRGKSGWAQRLSAAGDRFARCRPTDPPEPGPEVTPEVGWYVGYVESHDRVAFFALNIDMRKPSDAEQRRAIARRILEDEGLLDDRDPT
jgi:beta-lactamase class D